MLVVVLLAAGVTHASSTQNDAGSGQDAGDTLDASLRIPGSGDYDSELDSTDPSDWYKWKLSKHVDRPTCVHADTSSTTIVRTRLVSIDEDQAREIDAKSLVTRASRVGIAAPGFTGGFLHVHEDVSLTGLVAYPFTISDLRANQVETDGGSGGDAGAPGAGDLAVPAGCFGGKLDPGAGDAIDAYAFAGQMGDKVAISVADTAGAVTARIVDAAGQTLAETTGAIAFATVPDSGTLYVTTSSDISTTYVIGLCHPDCEPPQNPCHPMCIEILEST